MDAGERALLAETLRRAASRHTGPDLDAALDDLGWRDALAADPRAAVPALFEAQGSAGSTSAALDDVVVAALAVEPAPDLAAVLPPLGTWGAPGAAGRDGLHVDGIGTAGLPRRARAVVPTGGDDRCPAAVVETARLDLRAVGGLDPRLGLVRVAGDRVPVAWHPQAAQAATMAWPAAVAAGRRALAHELVGAARAMLDLARSHALERVQFGQPIARFQAVRHRLAETLVAIEAAAAALGAAWDEGTPFAAAVAKAIAGRSARTAARHAQQVLAGIGFTTEHPLHRYVRRVPVLDHLLGDARSLTRRVGADLLDRRTLPPMLPL